MIYVNSVDDINDVSKVDKELSIKTKDEIINETIKVCYMNEVYYVDSIEDLLDQHERRCEFRNRVDRMKTYRDYMKC